MCKENLYAKMEKLEAQICRCTGQGLKIMPWSDGCNITVRPVANIDVFTLIQKSF